MVDSPHDFDFVFQRQSALVPRVLFLFGKSFDGYHLMVSQSFSEIDGGEGSLSDFLFGLEQFMEVALVDFLLEL